MPVRQYLSFVFLINGGALRETRMALCTPMSTSLSLPLPLIKAKVLRAVVCTARYGFSGQEWHNLYLYMCCRMHLICDHFIEEWVGWSHTQKTRYLDLMANELVRQVRGKCESVMLTADISHGP